MAEGAFKHSVQELGYSHHFKLIDSYGTSSYHIGDLPDSRSAKTCRLHGINLNHRAQQMTPQEMRKFDYVIAMDESNLADLQHMKPRDSLVQVRLFGHWREDQQYSRIVEDPYYGGRDGFERNFSQIKHFTEQFLIREIGSP